ncbi:MAG TPA: transposase [Nanoarchaeota archaeon]|nr:transposase [Candidatus Woesearchaeota archaeon]HIH15639.1 transposase [Nanoarchaeota archaeon]HII13607.1 transposase [Nanoarchaeota archaeon]
MISLKERELILQWDKKGKSQEEMAHLLDCHQSSVSRFLKKYSTSGTIKVLGRNGRPTKLNKEVYSNLKEKILSKILTTNKDFCAVSTKEVNKIILKEIGQTYSLRHVERILHKLGFSLITPRSQHVRHDQEKADKFRQEFKKKLSRSMWAMN